MKRNNLYIIAVFALSLPGCSIEKKSVLKIYSYSQQVTPGIIPKITGENNTVTTLGFKPRINYFLYAENLKQKTVIISDIWIDSVHYAVQSEKITGTPVEIITNDGTGKTQKKQLVPKTLHDVFRLTPVSVTDQTIIGKKLSVMISSSQLVAGFIYKGKKYFYQIQKMETLLPAITQ